MDDALISPARHRFTVSEPDRMVESGVFGENHRIELIEGDLIDMAPIDQGHAAIVRGLGERTPGNRFRPPPAIVAWVKPAIRRVIPNPRGTTA
jgi:hypothetical protein